MPTMTIKQLGQRIRGDLADAQYAGRIPYRTGEYSEVRYAVRATNGKGGPKVNVTIESFANLLPGYPDPTSDQVAAWWDGPGAELLAEVERIRNAYNPDPPIYGGEVKFGRVIILSATMTSARLVSGGNGPLSATQSQDLPPSRGAGSVAGAQP